MKGWKTWLAAGATAVLGALQIMDGNTDTGLQMVAGALALIGIGHKLDKANTEK